MNEAPAPSHSLVEDVQGFLSGTLLCSIGVLILTHLGLVTGQTAGIAVLISYITGWNFGAVFFVVNIPFYWLAYTRMGKAFTIKSFVAVALLSVMTYFLPQMFVIERLDPILGAVLSGAMVGFGLIMLFRHGASLGGIGILGLYIQDKTGFRAGWVQMIFDAGLYGTALFFLPAHLVLISLLGAVILNVSIGLNHRPDRYIVR